MNANGFTQRRKDAKLQKERAFLCAFAPPLLCVKEKSRGYRPMHKSATQQC
jgi:hypothetical protein